MKQAVSRSPCTGASHINRDGNADISQLHVKSNSPQPLQDCFPIVNSAGASGETLPLQPLFVSGFPRPLPFAVDAVENPQLKSGPCPKEHAKCLHLLHLMQGKRKHNSWKRTVYNF